MSPGRRLLFKRGDSFVLSQDAIINVNGPGIIGAFGSTAAARPRVTAPGVPQDTAFIRLSSQRNPTIADWRVMDLEFDGGGVDAPVGIYGYSGFNQLLALRLYIHDLRLGAYYNHFLLDYFNQQDGSGYELFSEHFFVDTTVFNVVGGLGRYSLYAALQKSAVLGTSLDNNGGGTHVFRSEHARKVIISNSYLAGAGTPTNAAAHELKMHAYIFNSDVTVLNPNGNGTYTEQIIFSDNKIFQPWNNWAIDFGPQNGGMDERLRDIIVERNWFTSGNAAQNFIQLSVNSKDTTVRNNLFNATGMSDRTPLWVWRRGAGQMVPDQVAVYNNTFYSADGGSTFSAVSLDSVVTNVTIKNNLAYAPNDGLHAMVSGTGGSSLVVFNNSSQAEVQTSPGFVGPLSSPAGFAVGAASYAVGRGVSVPVFSDFFRLSRPQNSLFDLGAVEKP
jgi:hypothetical protein